MDSSIQKQNYAGNIILFTSLISFIYAIIRYHVLGDVPWNDFPFFIFNKGIALVAFILLILNFSIGPLKNIGINVSEGWLNSRKILGMVGFLFVLIHVFISMLLFKPEMFGKFFEENGRLTLYAGLSMLGGVLAFVLLWVYNLAFKTDLKEDQKFIHFITSRKYLLISFLFTMLHIFFMGYKGWLNPSGWNGGLPPISLVAFTIFITGYIINFIGRK